MRFAWRTLAACLIILGIALGVPIYSALYGDFASPLKFSLKISEAEGLGIASSFPDVLPFSLGARYLRFAPIGGSESARLQMVFQPPWFGTKLVVRETGTGKSLLDWKGGPLLINATFAWMEFKSDVEEKIQGSTANVTFPSYERFGLYVDTPGWELGQSAKGLEFLLSQGHDLRLRQNGSGGVRLVFFGRIYQAPAFEPINCSITISDSYSKITLDQPAADLLLDGISQIQIATEGAFSVFAPDWESITVMPESRFSMVLRFSRGTLALGANGMRDLQGTEEVLLDGVKVEYAFEVSKVSEGVSMTMSGETSRLFLGRQELGGFWDDLSSALAPYLVLAVVLIGLVAFHAELFLADYVCVLSIGALFVILYSLFSAISAVSAWGVLTGILISFWQGWYAKARKSRFKRLIGDHWHKPLRDELVTIQGSVCHSKRADSSVLEKSISDWEKEGRFCIDTFYPRGWLHELRELSGSVLEYDKAWTGWNDQIDQFARGTTNKGQVLAFVNGEIEYRKHPSSDWFTPFHSGTNDMSGPSIDRNVYEGLQKLKQKTDESEYTRRQKDQSWKREVQDRAKGLVERMGTFLKDHRVD